MAGRMSYLLLALTVAAEICLVGWWAAGGDPGLGAPLQLGVLSMLGLSLLAIRYARLKREHLDEIRARAAAGERTRLAEDMHDLLGHELSLIALEAGRLQVTRPDVAEEAANIRERASAAVIRLREIVGVLGEPGEPGHPASETVAQVVETSSRAGMTVHAELSPLGEVARPVDLTVAGLVREGLTNASRHSPGEPVTVRVARVGDSLRVEITNPTSAASSTSGSGLTSWGRRVRLLSGSLDTEIVDGVFRLRAELPAHTRLAEDPIPVGRPGLVLVRNASLPVLGVLVVLTAFWTWSSHDAELSAHDFGRIEVGQTETKARAIVPDHEARIRLSHEPDTPRGTRCDTYTDGNFPLAQSTYRVCFRDGRVVSAQDLRR